MGSKIVQLMEAEVARDWLRWRDSDGAVMRHKVSAAQSKQVLEMYHTVWLLSPAVPFCIPKIC